MIGAKLFIILILTSITAKAKESDLYICNGDLSDALPQTDSIGADFYNEIKLNIISPCEHKVNAPTSKEKLCQLSAKDFQSILCSKENMMGFQNDGGLFGLLTGVCWWHSQFHRLATYQAFYNKDLQRPNPNTVAGRTKIKKIFTDIIRKRGPVEIPGYSNLKEFTSDPKIKSLLQKRLQAWMAEDSFIKMQWYKGLTIPNNYSKKSADTFNKDKNRFMYPPIGEEYRQDMIALAELKHDELSFESDKVKKQELEKKLLNLNHKMKLAEKEYLDKIYKENIRQGKSHLDALKEVNKIKSKAEKAYHRNTYNSKDLELKKKEKTLKHQSKQINKLFQSVKEDKKITYITLQNVGIGAHSQIVFDAEKTKDEKTGKESFIFKVHDSNYQNDNYSKGFDQKGYSLLKYTDGRWYVDSAGNGKSFQFKQVNIKVHHNGQTNSINNLFEEKCGKKLFK